MRHPFLLILASFTTACVGTETGNPLDPDYTLSVEPANVTVSTLGVAGMPGVPAPPQVNISASPGAVQPATGVVFAWALENNLAATTSPVQANGSFGLDVPARPGERVRLQVRAGEGQLSAPVDIVVSEDGGSFTSFNTALSCLRTSPDLALQLVVGDEGAILITNECAETVTRSTARIREVTSGITLIDDGLLDLAPGEESTIRVRIDDAAASPANVLFSLSTSVQEIRAITIGVD